MVVGLTGGIGSGKTTVGKLFTDLGVPVYNSDLEAKKLMQTSGTIRKKIIELFGEESYFEQSPNTQFIAEKVFGDAEALKKLNGIIHPAVRTHFLGWMKKQKNPYVIQESALIFENGSQGNYDKIILVTAPLATRISRIMERDKSPKEKILQRVNNQLPDSEKQGLSHFVIENIDLQNTKARVAQIHSQIMGLA